MSACTKNCYGSKPPVSETEPKLPACKAPDQRADYATLPLAKRGPFTKIVQVTVARPQKRTCTTGAYGVVGGPAVFAIL